MNSQKFCLLIKGPDDLYAMPNKEVAEKCAKAHTKSMGPWIEVEHAKGSMLWLSKDAATVEVIPWPHSDEEFEEQLKEFNPKDWGLEEDKPNHEQ